MNLELGKILFTAAIADAVSNSNDFSAFVCKSFEKHKTCDWEDCDPKDLNRMTQLISGASNPYVDLKMHFSGVLKV